MHDVVPVRRVTSTVVLAASVFAVFNVIWIVARPTLVPVPVIAGTVAGIAMLLNPSRGIRAIGWGLGVGVLVALVTDFGLGFWLLGKYGS